MAKTFSKKINGVVFVNKPGGITSHDVVDIVRRKLGTQRVGHAGTLDPMAEGLLIVLVGTYTKLFSKFADFDKEYTGILKLGETTATGDAQGDIIKRSEYASVEPRAIREAFASFIGAIEQVPPMVSALRVKGKRLYNLARRGIVVERLPRRVTIHELEVIRIDLPYVEFYVRCSKGTYIRKLAEDIGEALGCGAHMVKILRLGIGPFRLEKAISLDAFGEKDLQAITF